MPPLRINTVSTISSRSIRRTSATLLHVAPNFHQRLAERSSCLVATRCLPSQRRRRWSLSDQPLAKSSLLFSSRSGQETLPRSDEEASAGPNDDASSTVSTAQSQLIQSQLIPPLSPPLPPWNAPSVPQRVATKRRNNNARFRQHVNPLASSYQRPTILPNHWPECAYTNVNDKKLHLDIGCGKGGFLIDLCLQRRRQRQSRQARGEEKEASTSTDDIDNWNYLGLEIRPGVAAYAKDRIATHDLHGQVDFLGCNANVDLDRLLLLYAKAAATASLTDHSREQPSSAVSAVTANTTTFRVVHCVTIQFPDPHFKTQHAKRRVVTPQLVDTLAKFMPEHATVFLQSDVQSVLDDMRARFRDCNAYFTDSIPNSTTDYVDYNLMGVPTEREGSVLIQGLPVYRALFTRNAQPHHNSDSSGTTKSLSDSVPTVDAYANEA